MALGAQLGEAGLKPTKIETHAAVTLGKAEGGLRHHTHRTDHHGQRSRRYPEVFDKAAANAKAGCPISKLFANNTEITLDAKLV